MKPSLLEIAQSLEGILEEEQDFRVEQLVAGEVQDENRRQRVTDLKAEYVKRILDETPVEILEKLGIDDVTVLTEKQKEALAFFSTQFEGEMITMEGIQSSYLLAASLNTLGCDDNVFSRELLRRFLSFTPEAFLEGSEFI